MFYDGYLPSHDERVETEIAIDMYNILLRQILENN